MGGAGGQHELTWISWGGLGERDGKRRGRGERYSISALLVFPWDGAGEAGCQKRGNGL